MPEYRTGSSLKKAHLQMLLPPPAAWLLYFIFSLILLAALNFDALSHQIWQQQFSSQDFAPVTDKFIDFQDKLALPAVMLFWVGIGIITYTFIWLFENIFFIAKGHAEKSKYVTGGVIHQSNYWRLALRSNGSLVALVAVWVFLIAVYLRYLLPAFTQLFHQALYGGTTSHRIWLGVASTLGNSVSIFIFWVVSRLLAGAWRSNRAD